MGDFHRGHIDQRWPKTLQQGVWLHRKIDAYTDQNPIFIQSKGHFSPARRRLSGIILDVCFDHFLSRHWEKFSSEPRQQFINQVYRDLEAYQGYCPDSMARVIDMMVRQDWLNAYYDLDGVSLVLDRMSRRFKRPTNLHGAGEEVENKYELLEQGFLEFFPQLVQQVSELKRP